MDSGLLLSCALTFFAVSSAAYLLFRWGYYRWQMRFYVLLCREWYGMSVAQIADHLRMSQSDVEEMLWQARKLRHHLVWERD